MNIYGQVLSVFDVDAQDFPKMKAKFFAFSSFGTTYRDIIPQDFVIYENGILRKATKITCQPERPPISLSSVLTIDISLSMQDGNFLLAKAGAKAWVTALNFPYSECALTAFDDRNYFIQDFTTNQSTLYDAIAGLTSQGRGTNFNAALLNPPAGALEAVKNGIHKRIIIKRKSCSTIFLPIRSTYRNKWICFNYLKSRHYLLYWLIYYFNPV